MTAQPLGQILDGLGCQSALEDGDLVSAAVVVLKVVEPDGRVRLAMCWSDGLCWIDRIGMLRAAERVELPTLDEAHEPD